METKEINGIILNVEALKLMTKDEVKESFKDEKITKFYESLIKK